MGSNIVRLALTRSIEFRAYYLLSSTIILKVQGVGMGGGAMIFMVECVYRVVLIFYLGSRHGLVNGALGASM